MLFIHLQLCAIYCSLLIGAVNLLLSSSLAHCPDYQREKATVRERERETVGCKIGFNYAQHYEIMKVAAFAFALAKCNCRNLQSQSQLQSQLAVANNVY